MMLLLLLADVCNDEPPPGKFTCSQQKKFGKCDAPYVRDWGYCALTCGKCNSERLFLQMSIATAD